MRLVSLALTLAIALIIIFPITNLLIEVFFPDGAFSLNAFEEALALPNILTEVIPNTLIVVLSSSALALCLATIFAWLNERTNARLGVIAKIMPLSPLIVPVLASTIGWVFLLSPASGTVNVILRPILAGLGINLTTGPFDIFNIWGLIFLYTMVLTAFAYPPIATALSQMDPSLEEAARVSGAGPIATFFSVALRANKHAIASAGLIAVVTGFATFSIPVILGASAGVDILSVEIFRLMTREFPARTQPAVALSFVMLVVIGLFWTIQQRINKARRFTTIGGKGMKAGLVDLGRLRWIARGFMFLFLALSSVLPFLGLLYVSLLPFWSRSLSFNLTLGNYAEISTSGAIGVRDALWISVTLGLIGAVLAVLITMTLVIYIGNSRGRTGQLADAVTKLPAVIPHLILGVAFLTTFSGPPFFLYGSLALLLMAYLIIFLPQTSIMANSAYMSISKELTEASAVSGAGGFTTARRVLFPLMLPGLGGVAAIQFVLIIGEATVSPLLANSSTPVLGYVMIGLWQSSTFPTIAALGVAMSLISATVVTFVIVMANRRAKLQ